MDPRFFHEIIVLFFSFLLLNCWCFCGCFFSSFWREGCLVCLFVWFGLVQRFSNFISIRKCSDLFFLLQMKGQFCPPPPSFHSVGFNHMIFRLSRIEICLVGTSKLISSPHLKSENPHPFWRIAGFYRDVWAC